MTPDSPSNVYQQMEVASANNLKLVVLLYEGAIRFLTEAKGFIEKRDLAGKARAIDLAATGRMIAFEEALEYGLLNDIFEGEDFFDQVLDYARQFVAPNKPSRAVGLIKRAIQTGLQGSQWEGLAIERELLAQAFASRDAAEGLSAYKEKRVAKFEGK